MRYRMLIDLVINDEVVLLTGDEFYPEPHDTAPEQPKGVLTLMMNNAPVHFQPEDYETFE